MSRAGVDFGASRLASARSSPSELLLQEPEYRFDLLSPAVLALDPGWTQLQIIGDKVSPRILITHQPSDSLVRYAEQKGYDLILGGHTRGGQIVVPLLEFPLTGSAFETRYVSGF